MTSDLLAYAATFCFALGAIVALAGFRVEALRDTAFQFVLVGLGALLKTLSIGVTCVQSEYHFFNSPSEICGVLAWALSCAYLLALLVSGARSLGALVLPVVVLLMIFSHTLSTQGVNPGASGKIFAVHILSAFLGYALFLMACGASVLYLEENRILKRKTFGVIFRDLPSLERIERLEILCAWTGLALFTVALVTGAVLLHQLNQPILMEPKFLCAEITWLVFLILVVGRALRLLHARAAAKFVLAGAALVALTFALAHPWAVPAPQSGVSATPDRVSIAVPHGQPTARLPVAHWFARGSSAESDI